MLNTKIKIIISLFIIFNVKAINIAFVCTNDYAWQVATAIASILLNAKQSDELNFYILNNDFVDLTKEKILKLKQIRKCKIIFKEINLTLFKESKCRRYNKIVLAKSLVCDKLKDLDKILLLDTDIIVMKSLSELWNQELGDAFAAVVQGQYLIETGAIDYSNHVKTHFNSGVMLLNAKKFREGKLLEKFILKSKKPNNGDEDIFITIFNGNVILVDLQWNVTDIMYEYSYEHFQKFSSYSEESFNNAVKNPAIIHFNNKSYLNLLNINYKYILYYLGKTEFTDIIYKNRNVMKLLLEEEIIDSMSILNFIYRKIRSIYKSIL